MSASTMSTSDREPPFVPSDPSSDLASALTKEIERLANQMFSAGIPGAATELAAPTSNATTASLPGAPQGPIAPNPGPSAMNVGAGGASPSVMMPPVPGPLQRPPLAQTPAPKESDLRPIVTVFSDQLGLSSAFALVDARESSAATPYFLDLAGVPSPQQAPSAASIPSTPSIPSQTLPDTPIAQPASIPNDAPSVPSNAGAPSIPSNVAAPSAPSAPSMPSTSALHEIPNAAAPPASPAPPAGAPAAPVPIPSGASYDFRPEVVPNLDVKPGLFDPNVIKKDFPILRERVHGREIVWLDNAATTQKPQSVIDRVSQYYEHENSNVHRGAHTLAARATDAYEAARDKVRRFLNAPSAREIVFVRGATEAINLVAQSFGRRNVGPGDEIVITWLEHHANIVPWQQLCSEKGARLRVAPVDDRGQVILDEYERLLGPRTRIVSFTQVSNALGTITPVREMVQMARRHGARVHVDGAQAVSHMPVDVQSIDCDFYSFSGHKIFAPTGIGVLYGKPEVLESMPPWQGGGNMISDVTFERTTYQPPPSRFEAGTGSIADAVGLGAALDYVTALGLHNIERYEHDLRCYAEEKLARVPGLRMIGTAKEKAGVLSFVLDGVRTEDVGGMLDQEGIAVRSGHHCAQPILRRFGLESTVRASLAPYNTCEDIDALVSALLRIQSGRPPRGL